VRDRLGLAVGDDGAIIDTPGQSPEMFTVGAEAARKQLERQPAEIGNRANTELLHDLATLPTDAPNLRDRQGVQKPLNVFGLDHDEAVRLLQVAGYLGQELVWRHTRGRDQPHFLADCLAGLSGDVDGRAEQPAAAGDIQERLIQRERFDQRRVAGKNLADLPRDFSVVIQPDRQENCLGAEPPGGSRGHGAMNPEVAGGVIGGRHDPALFGRTSHDDWPTDKFRTIPLLDRGVKSVHVDVNDHRKSEGVMKPYDVR